MAAKEKKIFCDVCGKRLGAFGRYSSARADLCADCYDLVSESAGSRWKDMSVGELKRIVEDEKVLEERGGYDVREYRRLGRRLRSLAGLLAIVLACTFAFYSKTLSYKSAPEKLDVTASLERIVTKDLDLDVSNIRPGSYSDEETDLRAYYGYYVDGERHEYSERHKAAKISEVPSGVGLKIYRRPGGEWKVYKAAAGIGKIFFVFIAAIAVRMGLLIRKRNAAKKRAGR